MGENRLMSDLWEINQHLNEQVEELQQANSKLTVEKESLEKRFEELQMPGCRLCLPVSMPLEEKAALYNSKKSVILRGKKVILRGKKVILRGKSVILRGKPFLQMT